MLISRTHLHRPGRWNEVFISISILVVVEILLQVAPKYIHSDPEVEAYHIVEPHS